MRHILLTILLLCPQLGYSQAAGGSEAKVDDPNLIFAVINKDYNKVVELLKKGSSPDSKDYNNQTALIYAILLGNQEIFSTLLEYGADVNIIDSKGKTALDYAQTNQMMQDILINSYNAKAGVDLIDEVQKEINALTKELNTNKERFAEISKVINRLRNQLPEGGNLLKADTITPADTKAPEGYKIYNFDYTRFFLPNGYAPEQDTDAYYGTKGWKSSDQKKSLRMSNVGYDFGYDSLIEYYLTEAQKGLEEEWNQINPVGQQTTGTSKHGVPYTMQSYSGVNKESAETRFITKIVYQGLRQSNYLDKDPNPVGNTAKWISDTNPEQDVQLNQFLQSLNSHKMLMLDWKDVSGAGVKMQVPIEYNLSSGLGNNAYKGDSETRQVYFVNFGSKYSSPADAIAAIQAGGVVDKYFDREGKVSFKEGPKNINTSSGLSITQIKGSAKIRVRGYNAYGSFLVNLFQANGNEVRGVILVWGPPGGKYTWEKMLNSIAPA